MHIKSARGFFPNRNTAVAELRPHSLLIFLHNIELSQVVHDVSVGSFLRLSENLPTIDHELTHWFDVISTVWGQRYLDKLFNAYSAIRDLPTGVSEYGYWNLITLFDEDRRILFPDYYKITAKHSRKHDQDMPWRYDFSYGQEFSSDGHVDEKNPIIFMRIKDAVDGKLISRHPISVGTLLECNATFEEMKSELSCISQIKDLGEKTVQREIARRRYDALFYDLNLIEYTSAAHIASSIIGIGFAYESYELGSLLSFVSLNLTPNQFFRFKIPFRLQDHSLRLRFERFKKYRNRGFAFVMLCFAAPSFSEGQDKFEWLDITLNNAGLPNLEKLLSESQSYLNIRRSKMPNRWHFDTVRDYILDIGMSVFDFRARRKNITPMSYHNHGIVMPPFSDSSGEFVSLFDNTLDSSIYDPSFMYDRALDLERFTRNFLIASRGFSDIL